VAFAAFDPAEWLDHPLNALHLQQLHAIASGSMSVHHFLMPDKQPFSYRAKAHSPNQRRGGNALCERTTILLVEQNACEALCAADITYALQTGCLVLSNTAHVSYTLVQRLLGDGRTTNAT
jgi:hypothetical protein